MKTAALVLFLGIGVSARPAEAVTRARYLMGTICEIDAADTREIDAAFAEAARVESVISTWRDDSELSRLNRGELTQVSAELFALLHEAMTLANDTGGTFNPLVRPLIDLWRTRAEGRVPAGFPGDSAQRPVEASSRVRAPPRYPPTPRRWRSRRPRCRSR